MNRLLTKSSWMRYDCVLNEEARWAMQVGQNRSRNGLIYNSPLYRWVLI